MNSSCKQSSRQGFTIVELLIVVVVIAILAAITIVAYNGVNNRARQNAMQSTASQVSKDILNYKTINGTFPASLGVLNNGRGPQVGTDAQYAYTGTVSSYCLTVGSLAIQDTYYVSDTTQRVQAGTCTGHTASAFQGYPTRGGYVDFTDTYNASNNTITANTSTVPDGAWMLVILAYTNNATSTAPAGWTTLVARKTTGSMQTSIFAKLKVAGDTADQSFTGGDIGSAGTTNAVLLWGANAAPVSSWTLGAFGDRASNATPATVVTPTISVPTAKSLVISVAMERTNTDEANYTSLTGANAWVWIPQMPSRIQTITVGYNEQASAGTSEAMTVTYPNTQVTNGTGIQIAIPPAN